MNDKESRVQSNNNEQAEQLAKPINWQADIMTDIMEKLTSPQPWKHAKVIVILKPGKPPTDTQSYRPMSLLCCLNKLIASYLDGPLYSLTHTYHPNRKDTGQKEVKNSSFYYLHRI